MTSSFFRLKNAKARPQDVSLEFEEEETADVRTATRLEGIEGCVTASWRADFFRGMFFLFVKKTGVIYLMILNYLKRILLFFLNHID